MNTHEFYIKRCIEIAKNGLGSSRPNPMVGSIIVHNNNIIGEGFTSKYGGNHAEVNAINTVKNKDLLKESTLYVTLEPCSHYGKTPPCSDFIIKHNIPNVVIGCIDDNEKVAGKGVKKLKEAGDIIIAKANLSEWANFRGEMSSSGWSGINGQTKNPYILDRNPCGSSAGSGAAVSAGLSLIAIGTETNGSIVCPSNANGVVGIKPTRL